MKPNCAIIRWSEESFAILTWDDEVLRASEFELDDPNDSYHELSYNQMMFAVYTVEDNSSVGIQSFTIQNDEDTELRTVEPEEMWTIISHILNEHFKSDVVIEL